MRVWIVCEWGGWDDCDKLYGIFTSQEKAERAARVMISADPHRDPTVLGPIEIDSLYVGSDDRRSALDAKPPEPDTTWDHMVVDGDTEQRPPPDDQGWLQIENGMGP